jgi:DNA-binding response OmpR family regulator
VLLDLMLPGMDGVSVLRRLMQDRPNQRVLVLSAVGDVTSKVRCLELGATDYLPQAVRGRRAGRPRAGAPSPAHPRAPRALGPRRRGQPGHQPACGRVPGRNVVLSQRELLLLEHLMRRAGDVCDREQLLTDVWGYAFDPGTNAVDVYVGRLRAKLSGELIETVRNVGYCFVAA